MLSLKKTISHIYIQPISKTFYYPTTYHFYSTLSSIINNYSNESTTVTTSHASSTSSKSNNNNNNNNDNNDNKKQKKSAKTRVNKRKAKANKKAKTNPLIKRLQHQSRIANANAAKAFSKPFSSHSIQPKILDEDKKDLDSSWIELQSSKYERKSYIYIYIYVL